MTDEQKEEKEKVLITKLGKLHEDPKKLEEIGSQIVVRAVKAVMEQRLGQKISQPSITRKVKEGEKVPVDLLGATGLIVSAEGIASRGWTQSWLNLLIWQRTWGDSDCFPGIHYYDPGDPLEKITIQNILTDKELEVVEKLKIISP